MRTELIVVLGMLAGCAAGADVPTQSFTCTDPMSCDVAAERACLGGYDIAALDTAPAWIQMLPDGSLFVHTRTTLVVRCWR